jgi:glycosyltransferase involved in cell wall biosynthesis
MSVVICAYTDRRWDVLVEAIEHVQAQVNAADEILIVIDHSPELLERVRERFPHLEVLENVHQNGLSGARNTGVARASRDVVVFLDDDAIPEPAWLQTLRQSYSEPRIIGVGGLVSPSWPDVAPSWMPDEFLWVVGCSYAGLPESISPIRNPIGANMSFRHEVFASVGGFSESLGRVGTLPVGCEETELHQPAAIVDHHISPDRTTLSYFVKRCWSEGLSKAAVTRLAEQSGSLATERSYVTKTVIPAVWRELNSARRGGRGAWGRAAVLILGTAVTGASYVLHSLRVRSEP